MKYVVFMSVSLMLALSSCNNQVEKERLSKIDSLGTHLNHVREVVTAVDSALIVRRLDEMNHTGEWLLDNLTDTLDRQTGLVVGDYLRCQKFYRKSMDRYKLVRNELEYSEKQLQNLRTDVKNSFYSEEEFKGYFETEATSVERLVNATDELEGTYEAVNQQYQKFKPSVTEILDSIKSVIYSSEPAR